MRLAGYAQLRFVNFYRGDPTTEGRYLLTGRLPEAAGEVMVGPARRAGRAGVAGALRNE
ncbi:hypothetical protein ACIP93_28310 [Streptomyces sp. NPDC088745]|uniref:hypothetical protein n=1 Tax=Streptomyces sp. NPDC088745 TaxID=3365884 RepID=UPI003809BCDE